MRTTMLAGRCAVAAAATALAMAATPGWASTATEEGAQEPASIMLVLDASGSMAADDASGGTRMEAARAALTQAVDNLPEDAEVGLRVYGATEPNDTKTEAACTDTQVVVPLGPSDPAVLKEAVGDVQPSGFTPTAYTLSQAADDLGDAGNRHIILVSDGEETCDPDPCETVRELGADGIDVQIDTVGYGVEQTARTQLRCIAEVTGGVYLEAPDADSLGVALDKLSTRALRGFSLQGIPVRGVDRDHVDEAPELAPGQYTDAVEAGGESSRYYRITGYDPEQRLQVALASRPPNTEDFLDQEQLILRVRTESGDSCADVNDFRLADSGLSGVVSPSTFVDPECVQTGEDLVLQVEREGDGKQPAPFELVVRQTPIAVDAESLPPGVTEEIRVPETLPEPSADPAPVVGGGGFSTATSLEPGTYIEQLIPGEEVFYKVAVGWGQSAQLVVDGPTDDSFLHDDDILRITPHLYTPGRRYIIDPNGLTSPDYDLSSPPQRVSLPVPEVRYRNAEDSYPSEARWVSEAGDFYLSLAIPPRYQGAAEGRPVPVQFTVAVEGEVTGVPTFPEGDAATVTDAPGASTGDTEGATTAPGAQDATTDAGVGTAGAEDAEAGTQAPSAQVSPDPASEPDGDRSWLWWVAGGALAVLVASGGGLWMAANRGRSQSS